MTGIDRNAGAEQREQASRTEPLQGKELTTGDLPEMLAGRPELDRAALTVIERFRRNCEVLQRHERVIAALPESDRASLSAEWNKSVGELKSDTGLRSDRPEGYERQLAAADSLLAKFETKEGIAGVRRDETIRGEVHKNAETILSSVKEKLGTTSESPETGLFDLTDPTARILTGLHDTSRNKDRYNRKVKKGLQDSGAIKELIKKPETLRNKGNGKIGVPYDIELPRFKYGQKGQGGVSKGEGEPGDPVDGKGEPQPGDEPGKAGEQEGSHELELTNEELREMIREELELPRIEPDEQDMVVQEEEKLKSLSRQGPRSRLHRKRTMTEALKRTMTENPDYQPGDPIEILPGDEVYKSFKTEVKPESGAIIIKIMDVSGSMTKEQKDLARATSHWLDFLLEEPYPDLEKRFIIHDTEAQEVDEHTFYHTTESGGTKISGALKKALDIITSLPEHQNIYIHHFTDGDNWGDDNAECFAIVDELINHPRVKHYGVFHTHSPYGDGQYCREVQKKFKSEDKVVVSDMEGRDDIGKAIKEQHGGKK